MRLIMTMRPAAMPGKFLIADSEQRKHFHVIEEGLTIGSKLRIEDISGVQLAHIMQNPIPLMSKQSVFIYSTNGGNTAESYAENEADFKVWREFFAPRYHIEAAASDKWSMQGNALHHEYSIFRNELLQATVDKSLCENNFQYALDIVNEELLLPLVALALAIDRAVASRLGS